MSVKKYDYSIAYSHCIGLGDEISNDDIKELEQDTQLFKESNIIGLIKTKNMIEIFHKYNKQEKNIVEQCILVRKYINNVYDKTTVFNKEDYPNLKETLLKIFIDTVNTSDLANYYLYRIIDNLLSIVMPEFKYITIFGKYLISTLDEKPKDAYENLSHDGYDRDGPESNLWDLTLIYDSKEIVYHREDWYRGRDELYSLLEF